MKNERELLEFQVVRSLTSTYKGCLILIESLQKDHDHQFDKLKKALPDHVDIIEQAKYLDDAQFNFLRKKILDSGNDIKRELISYMDNFDIKIKK